MRRRGARRQCQRRRFFDRRFGRGQRRLPHGLHAAPVGRARRRLRPSAAASSASPRWRPKRPTATVAADCSRSRPPRRVTRGVRGRASRITSDRRSRLRPQLRRGAARRRDRPTPSMGRFDAPDRRRRAIALRGGAGGPRRLAAAARARHRIVAAPASGTSDGAAVPGLRGSWFAAPRMPISPRSAAATARATMRAAGSPASAMTPCCSRSARGGLTGRRTFTERALTGPTGFAGVDGIVPLQPRRTHRARARGARSERAGSRPSRRRRAASSDA